MKRISIFISLLFFSLIVKAYAYQVIPSGDAVGIIVKTQGLIVTNTSKVTDVNGHTVNLANLVGIKPGDIITDVNGKNINTSEELVNIIQSNTENLTLKILRNNKSITKTITPIKTPDGNKLGLWVRSSAAGIGTITYIDPKTKEFVGLGHPITDVDTNLILPVREGNILKCNITTPKRGNKGSPGELNGIFYNNSLGKIETNQNSGIYGYLTEQPKGNLFEISEISEINKGDAYIMANVDGNGVKKYNISIIDISDKNFDNRNMIIEITDKELLNLTGGIVQGMSGAPIIQNNKLIGAITHVFVNNPKQGYGIFAKNMINKH